MGSDNQVVRLTTDEYLAWESLQPKKNEFFFGEVFAMVGTTDAQNMVAGNVFALLRAHLRSTACRVFISDVKVRPVEADVYFYPDVFVTCDERDRQSRSEKSHPLLIVEVLSPSTGDFDRGEKFAVYRRIAELREYVLIDPERRSIDLFQRGEDDRWTQQDARAAVEIVLESIELTLQVADVFEGLPAT